MNSDSFTCPCLGPIHDGDCWTRRPASHLEPVMASSFADNLVYMNQMTTTEVWSDVSSPDDGED